MRNVGKWGNSAGVLLPKEWMGNQVKVILIDRTLEIKKEALNLLEPYLEDILGVYLAGSYARAEQEKNSDIDIIAISGKTKKEIVSGKYNLSIIPLESVKRTLDKNPLLILPRLNESKVILNKALLEELKDVKIQKNSFKEFIEECERVIRINKEIIELDKEQGKNSIDSAEVIYSLILRLRGIFLANTLVNKKKYYKKDFLSVLDQEIEVNSDKIYSIYNSVKNNKKVKVKVNIEIVERMLELLEREVKTLK